MRWRGEPRPALGRPCRLRRAGRGGRSSSRFERTVMRLPAAGMPKPCGRPLAGLPNSRSADVRVTAASAARCSVRELWGEPLACMWRVAVLEGDEWLTTRRRASEPAAVVGSRACVGTGAPCGAWEGRMPSPRRTSPGRPFPSALALGSNAAEWVRWEDDRLVSVPVALVERASACTDAGARMASRQSPLPVPSAPETPLPDSMSRAVSQREVPGGSARRTSAGWPLSSRAVMATAAGSALGLDSRRMPGASACALGEQRDRSAAVGGLGHLGELASQSICRLRVCGCVEFRDRADDELPVALPGADAAGEALDGVALLDVGRGELCRVSRFEGQGDGAEAAAGVVEGGDGDDGWLVVSVREPQDAAQRRLA